MSGDWEQLAKALAAMLAPATKERPSKISRALILRTQGADDLFEAVFEPDLLNLDRQQAIDEAERMIEFCHEEGITVTPNYSPNYPYRLRQVFDDPGIIFTKGELISQDNGISIVGSRSADRLELAAACDIAGALSAEGITVVSGLARGIDAEAHEAAIRNDGRTVAVMGTAPEKTYPAEHKSLRAQIESHGLTLTQFPPGFSGGKFAFPMRNVTMSGYSAGTIVVAAGENSGTKHQALAAVGHGHLLLLTPTVATQTSWGRQMVEKEQAVVAHNVDEAVAACKAEIERTQNFRTVCI